MRKNNISEPRHLSVQKTAFLPDQMEYQSRIQFQADILKNVTDSVIVTDFTGQIIYWNKGATRLFGYTEKEMLGKTPAILYPGQNPRQLKKDLAQILKGVDYRGEWEGLTKKGKKVLVDIHTTLLKDTHGKAIGFIGVATDITEQKKAQEELKQARDQAEQQKRLYEAITKSTPDLIYAFDLNKRFTYANEALLTMWGKTKEESLGKGLRELGYEEWHAEMHEREIDQIIATKKPIRGEVSFPHATLGKRLYDYIFVPVLDAKGKVVAIAGTTRDITELKELSKQKDEFLGIASHELKTPVTSIKAYGQVLQRIFQKEGHTTAVAQLAKMDAQINRLTDLISDLLDVTKIQSGKLIMQESTYDFNKLVTAIVDDLQLTTDRHTLVKKLAPPVKLYGDRERTGQVLTNLITNAIKYSPHSKKIIITTEKDAKTITLCVRDYGVGIPKDKQDKVFEQFFRVSGDKQHTFPGLGLGLYISSEIIKRQGGKIWVESREGKGSTFCFRLPLKRHQTKSKESSLGIEAAKHE